MDELTIINQLKDGNLDAIDLLYSKYSAQALRTAYLITSDRYMAEDIVQEAFITCYNSIHSLKNPALFRPWFFKLLTRLSWRYIKKQNKAIPTENIIERLDIKQSKDTLDNYNRSTDYDKLYEAIENLNLKLKTTVILFYFNELSIKEIAIVTGCLEGTVKSRLHNARKALKNNLTDLKEGQNNEICKLI